MIVFTVQSLRKMTPIRPAGYLEDVLSAGQIIRGADGEPAAVKLTAESFAALVAKYDPGRKPPAIRKGDAPVPTVAPVVTPRGPGTELHAILRDWLGIEPTADCPCRSMSAKMDRLGPDWCEGDGMPEILGVMRGEHAKRWADGRTLLPWSDLAARQLVLLACRRARARASA